MDIDEEEEQTEAEGPSLDELKAAADELVETDPAAAVAAYTDCLCAAADQGPEMRIKLHRCGPTLFIQACGWPSVTLLGFVSHTALAPPAVTEHRPRSKPETSAWQ